MSPYLRRMVQSTAIRPVTSIYVVAVIIIVTVAEGWTRADVGVVLLAIACHFSITASMRRELTTVHHLVNASLIARVDQLIEALHEAGIDVPRDPRSEKS